MKRFFITIDTEGDNLWDWREGMDIHTENKIFPLVIVIREEKSC